MSEHRATLEWTRKTPEFAYETYSRDHTWTFPSGVTVRASAAPDFLGNPDHVDPEEAFVATLSSCHMLTFLAIAARRRLIVDRYEDSAVGHMEKNAEDKLAVTRAILRPRVTFGGSEPPSADEIKRLHELAHEQCFIANSVRTVIAVEPQA